MRKSFLSSVILTAVIGLSSNAFASTQVTAKTQKDPVKVETKLANHKKTSQKTNAKVSMKKTDAKAKKVTIPAHSMAKKAK